MEWHRGQEEVGWLFGAARLGAVLVTAATAGAEPVRVEVGHTARWRSRGIWAVAEVTDVVGARLVDRVAERFA